MTISLEDKNREEIESCLKLKVLDWDLVVKVSTAHYVFPALYCNLKRANLLKYLPQDLVSYMQYITDLNRERNKKIILQAKQINNILLDNNITPIFLKGTGNLLAEIYLDIAERMVGDIDFILSKEDYSKAITILRDFGYSDVHDYEYHLPYETHYRRLKKENSIAAIEIHKELLDLKKYSCEFDFSFVNLDNQVINGVSVLSYANKINLSIIADQINDNGFLYKTIALRNAYDVYLLSKKTDTKEAINKLDKLNNPLNCFLAACYEIFNKVDSLKYNNTKITASYLKIFDSQFTNKKITKTRHILIKTFLFLKVRLSIIYKSIIYKDYRLWLFKRLIGKR